MNGEDTLVYERVERATRYAKMQDLIQTIVQDAREGNSKFYQPSPGQIDSHVDYRVSVAIASFLSHNGYKLVKENV